MRIIEVTKVKIVSMAIIILVNWSKVISAMLVYIYIYSHSKVTCIFSIKDEEKSCRTIYQTLPLSKKKWREAVKLNLAVKAISPCIWIVGLWKTFSFELFNSVLNFFFSSKSSPFTDFRCCVCFFFFRDKVVSK